jgi:hypothetical protein
MITGGQVADCTAGELLLEQMPHAPILHGDKGYDSNAIRRRVEGKGVMPNIPPKPIGAGRIAFRRSCTVTGTPSNARSVASKTSGGLPHATID